MNELNNYKNVRVKKILVYGMTNNRGGMESYLMNYYRILINRGIVFDFVTDHEEIAYKEEIDAMGGKVYHIPTRRQNLVRHMIAFRKILLEHKEYKAVYYNILSASEVFTVLSTFGIGHVKRIVHAHANSVQTMGRHKMLRPLLSLLAQKKLSCSDEAADFMFGKSARKAGKVQIINNAINISEFAYDEEKRNYIRASYGLLDDQYVVGHVGRMCHAKNNIFLLDIFKEISEKDPRAVLMMVGDGEDRPMVEEKIRKSGLEDKVLMLGMRDDVAQLMLAMDVFLLPSRYEGFGIVLLEAQASGIHCVTSKTVVPEITNIAGGVTFVDLSESAEYWADTVLKYRQTERKNYCKEIHEAGYSIEEVSEILEKTLKGF